MDNDTREFYLSLRKMLPDVAVCALFAVGGGWLVHVSGDTIGQLIGWAALLFFGLGTFVLLAVCRLRSKRPYVVVSEAGVRVNSPLVPKNDRFFPWSAVAGFRFGKVSGKKLILIDSTEAAGAGAIERGLLKFNKRIAGAPYMIETSSLSCKPEVLLALLTERLEHYRRGTETA